MNQSSQEISIIFCNPDLRFSIERIFYYFPISRKCIFIWANCCLWNWRNTSIVPLRILFYLDYFFPSRFTLYHCNHTAISIHLMKIFWKSKHTVYGYEILESSNGKSEKNCQIKVGINVYNNNVLCYLQLNLKYVFYLCTSSFGLILEYANFPVFQFSGKDICGGSMSTLWLKKKKKNTILNISFFYASKWNRIQFYIFGVL